MKEIIDAIRNGSCVVFAGAGISRDAGLPSWSGLAVQLYDRLHANGHIPATHQAAISSLINSTETFKDGLDLLVSVVRRQNVAQELREILTPERESQVHQALKRLYFKGFLTTNYDRLLNSVISNSSWIFTNSSDNLKVFSSAVNSQGTQFLLKLHGDIDNTLPPDDMNCINGAAFMVLSKGDFTALKTNRLEKVRLALHAVLQRYSILFLGYGFGDPDISQTLEFLSEHCQFSMPSWFVGLKGGQLPQLPNSVASIQPIAEWNDLAGWLLEIHKAIKETSQADSKVEPPVTKVPSEFKHAVQTLGEYLVGLESDNLCEKTIGSILVPELLTRDTVESTWIAERIGKVLNIGPLWAETFASAAIRHLADLKMIEQQGQEQIFRVIKVRVNRLHQKANSEWTEDKTDFFDSIKRRLAKSGGDLSESFFDRLNDTIQHLCMGFGRRMAEWVVGGIGRDIGVSHVRELVAAYFTDSDDRRRVEELLTLVFDRPTDGEISYIYRLLSSSFLLSSVKIDPTAVKFLKESISEYELFLDSNVLLPLLIEGHKDHRWMRAIIGNSKEAGARLYVVEDIVNEIYAHRRIAGEITACYGSDVKGLSIYATVRGQRANCFIQGFLNISKQQTLSANQYLLKYTDQKLKHLLSELEIAIVPLSLKDLDINRYRDILQAITEEWSKKFHYISYGDESQSGRPSVLNENEARQFLYLYKRRNERIYKENNENSWFLSFETVLEKVYLRDPQSWGKPPTFPVSAWASFLDSRLLSDGGINRRDILSAIIKGNSTTYALPDSVSLVRQRAFGNRVLSKAEDESMHTSISNAMFFNQLEKARVAVVRRSQKNPSVTKEFGELQDEAVRKVKENLSEAIDRLKRQLLESEASSNQEVATLKKTIEELQGEMKRRGRHKKGKKGITNTNVLSKVTNKLVYANLGACEIPH